MARAMGTDPLQVFRFHVDAIGIDGYQPLVIPGNPQAGFTDCSAPAMTAEVVTYKEGNYVYERKFPGTPKFAEITLQRGVIRRESIFWNWMLQVAEGPGEYRADVSIKHFHRDTSLLGVAPPRPSGTPNFTQLSFENPAYTYVLFDAFPAGNKLTTDFVATDSGIAKTELTLAFERVQVLEGATG